MKKTKRILSAAMVLLLTASLPVNAFAAEWYMENGDITVNAGDSGQTVTQGSDIDVPDVAPVITRYDSSKATTNTVTINANGTDVTAEVTIKDVYISAYRDGAAVTINAADGAEANVTLDGVDITAREAAISTEGEGNVTIELDNDNTIKSGDSHAGLEKNNTGTLTITDTDNNGSLDATGGEYGAGIGGAAGKGGSNIIITGGTVTATGGTTAAGIGGGGYGLYNSGNASNISIWGDTQLKVQGGAEHIYNNGKTGIYAGAAIGTGGNIWSSGFSDGLDHHGTEVTPNTDELTKDGKIEYYAPGVDMSSSTPAKTVTGTHEHTWNNGEVTKEATCAEAGVMTYTCAAGNDFTRTEEIAATENHNIVIDPAVEPTYTSTGLTAGQHCTTCDTQTIEQEEIPMLQHKTTPSAAANATGEGAENSAYAAPSETPLYRVIDAAGAELAYTESQEKGVLTIMVNQETAVLTGYLSGISQLKAQGVETIVFGTNGRASAFRLEDLLANGNGGDNYRLTHSGAAAAFTIGAASTDISAILF